ncbi:hypothetical protein SARC_08204 [Sphaeroforma arctica JP610]|uniref:Uncharacterized protein n=1 Tax=Sphaeroforma arctica JP610 TaxID=667725 RepID=A0A0L0FRT5_9EUKA|nr:hypothetical protein SARC_08204 [Sphaeroforma arctica JP610]KNC79404.1 hypothetical protein SARC_08204 [Sphaeroforma arctica JP610]|eukprot:XP_014153306.1 hypothetical protein SARC_08204 [Sphaeroforma arctica JP610]
MREPQELKACFPNPQNPELSMQSVVADNADWGRTTTYQTFQTTVANNKDRPYLGERTVVQNEDGSTTTGDYKFISFKEADETATHIGSALKSLGVARNTPRIEQNGH